MGEMYGAAIKPVSVKLLFDDAEHVIDISHVGSLGSTEQTETGCGECPMSFTRWDCPGCPDFGGLSPDATSAWASYGSLTIGLRPAQ